MGEDGRQGMLILGKSTISIILDMALAVRAFIRLRARELCQW